MKRFLPHIALTLVLAELLLMLLSWILSAAMPMSSVRSMLSGEGIRWFLGHFADMMATPLLVWILLLAMAYGCLMCCGVLSLGNSYRERRALWLSLAFFGVYVATVLLLTIVPHAVLLSASGTLWPSPFSASLVPVVAFGLLTSAWLYGMIAGTFNTLSDVYDALLHGIRIAAPLLLFYVLVAQLYYSVCYVLS